MTLISTLIALGLELFFPHFQSLKERPWLDDYLRRLREWFGAPMRSDGPVALLVILAPPLLLVLLLQGIAEGVWLGLFELLFSVVVLFYALRFQQLDHAVDEYLDAVDAGTYDRARALASHWLGEPPQEEDCGARQLAGVVLLESVERLFGVLLWFIVLGPMGALLFHLSWKLASEGDLLSEEGGGSGLREAAGRLHGILGWIPVRVAAASFALAGQFEAAFQAWGEVISDRDPQRGNRELLSTVGLAAAGLASGGSPLESEAPPDPSPVRAARGLVLRALLGWLLVVALVTLVGWFS